MEIMVKLELTALPGNGKKVESSLQNIIHSTQNFSGCEEVKLSRFPMDPNKFIIVEYWESSDHYLAYGEWRGKSGDFEKLRPLLSVEMDMQILEVVNNTDAEANV